MAALHVLRVFCEDEGDGGNPLGVFLDGPAIAPEDRQAIATDLGFSETVFIDDPARGEIRIFTPAAELPFAGHPVVGTAWLLADHAQPVRALRPPAGVVPVRSEGDLTLAAGRPEWAPDMEFAEVGSAEEVEALAGPPEGHDFVGVWAWIDERAARIRVRVFAARYGIPEDEATGAAAIRLTALLGRPLDIRQGRGSRILTRPLPDGMVEIAGRVRLDEIRPWRTSKPPLARKRLSSSM